jgi:hypothetical protein
MTAMCNVPDERHPRLIHAHFSIVPKRFLVLKRWVVMVEETGDDLTDLVSFLANPRQEVQLS